VVYVVGIVFVFQSLDFFVEVLLTNSYYYLRFKILVAIDFF
jgi:hypothetical protein